MENAKQLPTELKKNSFYYTLAKRGNKCLMYEQRIKPTDVNPIAFEVFKIKYHGANVGKPEEAYPNNESFGKTAWCFSNQNSSNDKALLKFEELENEITTEA
jgi:hypothetical protein